MQPLGTKKITQTFGKLKCPKNTNLSHNQNPGDQNPVGDQNHPTFWDKKNHPTSQDKKNH